MSNTFTKVTQSGFLQTLKRRMTETAVSTVCAFAFASGLWHGSNSGLDNPGGWNTQDEGSVPYALAGPVLLDNYGHESEEALDERKVTAVATYNPMNNDELVHYQGDLYCEPQDQARDTSAALVIRRRGPGSLIHEALEAAERGETVPESSWLDAYADELLHWVTTNETNAIEVADYNSTSPEYVEMTRIRSADVPPPAASDTFHRARSALFMAPRHELYRRTSAPPLNPELVIASPSTAYGAAKPARRRPSYFEDEHEEPRLNESKPGSKGFRLGDADEQQQKKQQPGNEQYPIDTLAAPPAEATVRSNEERKHPKEADVLRIDDDLILVASANGILMLERDVEVYAWRERRVSTRTERSSVTNAETKTEEYAYTQEWMSIGDLQDSSKFESPMGHENPDPRLLPIVRSRYFASTVQLGPFILGRHELGPDGRPHISEDVKSLLRLIPRRVLPVRKALLRIESITRHAKEAAAEWIDGAWQPASTNYPSAPACIELLSNREDEWHYLLVRPAERQREINFLTSTHVLGRQTTENFRATWRTASHREQFRQRYSAMYAGDGGDELVEESDYFDQYEEVLEGPSIGLSTVDDTSARPLAHALEYRPVPGGFEEPPTYEEATREATSSTPGGVLPWLSDRLPRVEENYFPFGRPLSLRSSTYRPRVGDLRVRWTVVRGPIPLTLIARQLAPLAGTFSQLQDHLNPITLNLVRSASGPETLTIRPPSGEEEVQWRAERYNLRPRLVDIDIGSVYQGRIPLAETIQRQKLSLSRLIFFGKLILGALTGLSAFSIFRSIGEYVPEILLIPTLLKPTNYMYSIPFAASLIATALIGARLTRWLKNHKRAKLTVWLIAFVVNVFVLLRLLKMYSVSTFGPSVDLFKRLLGAIVGMRATGSVRR